jgi:hypothetical protein
MSQIAELTPEESSLLTGRAIAHGLGTTLAVVMRRAGLPVAADLEEHRFEATVRHTRILATLHRVAPALTDAGIPWVVLKGPVIADSLVLPAVREFADLDLLVSAPRLGDALTVLGAAGVETVNRNWEAATRYGVAEFPVATADTTIDLHWHVIGLGTTRRRFGVAVDEMMKRRVAAPVGGVDGYRFDPEDQLIHVSLHCGLGGADRLAGLRDVHVTVATSDLDWDVVAARAVRYGAGPIVGQVLDRCRLLLGTPVGSSIPSRMAPGIGLATRAMLDRWSLRGSSDKLCSGFAVAVGRRGVANTIGSAFELVRDRVAVAMGRPRRWSAHDPDGPLFWLRPTGGPDGLERYLRMATEAPPSGGASAMGAGGPPSQRDEPSGEEP